MLQIEIEEEYDMRGRGYPFRILLGVLLVMGLAAGSATFGSTQARDSSRVILTTPEEVTLELHHTPEGKPSATFLLVIPENDRKRGYQITFQSISQGVDVEFTSSGPVNGKYQGKRIDPTATYHLQQELEFKVMVNAGTVPPDSTITIAYEGPKKGIKVIALQAGPPTLDVSPDPLELVAAELGKPPQFKPLKVILEGQNLQASERWEARFEFDEKLLLLKASDKRRVAKSQSIPFSPETGRRQILNLLVALESGAEKKGESTKLAIRAYSVPSDKPVAKKEVKVTWSAVTTDSFQEELLDILRKYGNIFSVLAILFLLLGSLTCYCLFCLFRLLKTGIHGLTSLRTVTEILHSEVSALRTLIEILWPPEADNGKEFSYEVETFVSAGPRKTISGPQELGEDVTSAVMLPDRVLGCIADAAPGMELQSGSWVFGPRVLAKKVATSFIEVLKETPSIDYDELQKRMEWKIKEQIQEEFSKPAVVKHINDLWENERTPVNRDGGYQLDWSVSFIGFCLNKEGLTIFSMGDCLFMVKEFDRESKACQGKSRIFCRISKNDGVRLRMNFDNGIFKFKDKIEGFVLMSDGVIRKNALDSLVKNTNDNFSDIVNIIKKYVAPSSDDKSAIIVRNIRNEMGM